MTPNKFGTATAAKTPMITITIMISIRENPFCLIAKIPYKPLFFNIHHFIVVVAQHNAIL